MGEQKALLTLNIDTSQPVEIGDFVGAFTSLANEFERFVEDTYPNASSDPRMYVREVRHGSIEADIVTGFVWVGAVAMSHMDQIIILEDFVRRWGSRLKELVRGGVEGEVSTAAEFKDWTNAVAAIANDPIAAHRLEASVFEDGKRELRASFTFKTPEARSALQTIEDRKRLLSKPDTQIEKRVLMVFTRSDVNDAHVGKSSGERVKVEELSPKSLALMYGSEVAEARIKHEIREADENVFKKGFVVDVAVKMRNGTPAAYSVLAVHDVIDLPD